MKGKIFFLASFLVLTPVLITTEVILLGMIKQSFRARAKNASGEVLAVTDELNREKRQVNEKILSYSGQENEQTLFMNVISADARPILVKRYLEKYNSPLAEFSELIFDVSQRYGLDYRMIVAIAQQESNLCKKSPVNCFNCWGAGIHSRGTMCFDDYPQGIEWMAKYLKEEYLDKGRQTVDQIMEKYCPLSNGSWAFGVKQFMAEME